MRHRTIAIGLVTALLLFLMAWSFVSSAASGRGNGQANKPSETNEAGVPPQGDEAESVDADLGKFGSRIDRDEYLRLRDEYIGRKRGIEPGRPFNPEMRTRAIEQMTRQEKGFKIDSIVRILWRSARWPCRRRIRPSSTWARASLMVVETAFSAPVFIASILSILLRH